MSHPPHETPATLGAPDERRHTPVAARGPYLAAVRRAWERARTAGAAVRGGLPPELALDLALAAYARDGRARQVPVDALLRALDTVVRAGPGGDPDADGLGAWARARLIRRYYGAD